jgi:disulfide bond formation protein DsbB
MMVPRLRVALALSALAAAAALLVAYAAEHWERLVPCALCLVERRPYRLALGFALVGLLLPLRWARGAAALVLLSVLTGAATAAVHVGVEQQLWASPLPQCQAPQLGSGTIAQRLARMPKLPSVACEDPTYLVPAIPISMATGNLLFALAFAAALAAFLWRSRGSEP